MMNCCDVMTYNDTCAFNCLIFLKEFMEKKPSLLEMESDIQHYDCIEVMVDKIESLIILESIELSTGKELIICSILGFNMYFISCT